MQIAECLEKFVLRIMYVKRQFDGCVWFQYVLHFRWVVMVAVCLCNYIYAGVLFDYYLVSCVIQYDV